MMQRLQLEWMKMKNYKAFWILLGLYLVSIIGSNYIVFRIQQEMLASQQAKNMAKMIIGQPPYSFPMVWQMAGFVSGFMLFIPGLVMIISVTNEYSYKTHRQNIIDGWTRRDFIVSKMLLALALTVISTIMVFLAATMFGFMEGSERFSLDRFSYIGYFFLQALSYIMVALLMAVVIKRGGLAIGVYFMYALVIENMIATFMKYRLDDTGRYLPLQSADELIPTPVLENLRIPKFTTPDYSIMITIALVYLAAYFVLTGFKFEKDDL
jgi:ABC-2 type transport system permease protein